ncbi:MAG: GTPase [Gammaproteobacteria bacterium]
MQSEKEYRFFSVLEQARNWAAECRDLGWLDARDVERFTRIEHRSPASLFRDPTQRPLVAAFFGGTGVGKSTLLNRLAGHEIARTGVVRPTSREVSLYLHRDLDLNQLPENFPVEKVRIDRHENPDQTNVLWMDMPDIDSTESSNRKIVLEWLPHIDILVYVVSPERYRDEKGWRLLLSEGSRHAWVFVMNQFDRGDPSQLQSFHQQLVTAGFQDPILLATDCSPVNSDKQDEFKQLKSVITGLADRHTVEQLELRNINARMREIEKTIEVSNQAMGNTADIDLVLNQWEKIWRKSADDLEEGVQWPIQEAARSIGSAGGGNRLIKQLASDAEAESPSVNPLSAYPMLWDDWAQTRFEDALDQLMVTAGANHIPLAPFKNHLSEIRSKARKILHSQTEQSLRRALANPGNKMRRLLLNTARICSGLFPLAAIGWIAYEVLARFHASNLTGVPYLGLNFAVHSGLLILLSWLLPWFIYKKFKPSTEEVAAEALQSGARLGLEYIKSRIDDELGNLFEQRRRLVDATEALKTECRSASVSDATIEDATLSRMLTQQSTR